MLHVLKSDILPIGIDVGNDAVKMLQLRRFQDEVGQSPRYAVIAAARRRFSEAGRAHPESRLGELPAIIRQLRQVAPFVGRRAVAAMPSPWLVFRTLRIEEAQPVNRAAIFDRLGPQLSASPGECRLGIVPCGSVRQGNESAEEVLAFATPNRAIDAFLESLHRGGLAADALDVEQCAAWRAFVRSAANRPDYDQALLEIGERRSVLMIGRCDGLRFAKPIEIGSRQLDEAICRRLGLPADDARELRLRGGDQGCNEIVRTALIDATRALLEKLASAIAQCLRYYAVAFRGAPVRGLHISGGDSIDPHMLSAMESLPLPVRSWNPFRDIDIAAIRRADLRGNCGQWTVALGLALRGEAAAPTASDVPAATQREAIHA